MSESGSLDTNSRDQPIAAAAADEKWMRRALDLAARGRGAVEPNPMVGAVVVRNGVVVGEGYHQRYGGPHAEVHALEAAGAAAAGSTLYVTLEPCCHHGKTPPCTDSVLRSGVRRVVAAMQDPFPQVAGGGLNRLRDAGLEVAVGVLEAAARQLNAPYLTLVQQQRPYVTAKWAMTLDGRIATVAGESKWITGPEARAFAHGERGCMDAIVAGIGTVLADDPLLTARPPGPRVPLRVVMDRTARLPVGSQLARTAGEVPTLLVTALAASADRVAALQAMGCSVLPMDGSPVEQVAALLAELGRRRLTNVLVEGGAGVLGSFVSAGLIDAVQVYVAPLVVGGSKALGPVGGAGLAELSAALRLGPLAVTALGADVLLQARRLPR